MKNRWRQFSIKHDKKFQRVEDYTITIIISTILVFSIVNKILIYFNVKFASYGFDKYLVDLKKILVSKDGTLITVAAVFIGIYFTVFSLLSSIKIESTFAILTEDNFKRLLKFIRNAFIGSFIYLFYSLFSGLLINEWVSSIVTIALLLYMLLSALRFGAIIYSIFSNDLKKFHEQLEKDQREKERLLNLNKRLEAFLAQQELAQNASKSLDVSKKIKDRQNNKDNQ